MPYQTLLLSFLVAGLYLDIIIVNSERYKTTIFRTKYGSLFGTRVNFDLDYLKPVDIVRGIEYGSTRNDKLRFLPPSGSLDKWQGIRNLFKYRAVCPQKVLSEKGYQHYTNFHTNVIHQREDCQTMNIFIIKEGRIHIQVDFRSVAKYTFNPL